MRYLVLSCSLNPKSRSRILACMVHEHLAARPGGAAFVDLQDYDLPISDAGACPSGHRQAALTALTVPSGPGRSRTAHDLGPDAGGKGPCFLAFTAGIACPDQHGKGRMPR